MARRIDSELELTPTADVKSALKLIYNQAVAQKMPYKLGQINALINNDRWDHLSKESNMKELIGSFVPVAGILNQQRIYENLSEMLDEDEHLLDGDRVRKGRVIKIIYDILSLFKAEESFSAAYSNGRLIFYKV